MSRGAGVSALGARLSRATVFAAIAAAVRVAACAALALALLAAPRPACASANTDSLAAFRRLLSSQQLGPAESRTRAWLASLGAGAAADTARAAGLDLLSEVLLAAGRWKAPADRAVPQQAVDANTGLYGAESPQAGSSLIMQARILYREGDWEAARPLAERGLAQCEKAYGNRHISVLRGLHYLANIYENESEFALAEQLYRREIAVAETLYGAESAQLGNAMNSLGVMYHKTGRWSECRPLYERALGIREKALGLDSPDLVFNYNNLANVLTEMGDLDRARFLYQRALDVVEKKLGPQHVNFAFTLGNLAGLEIVAGDTLAAMRDLERAIALGEEVEGRDHPDLAAPLDDLGGLLIARHEYARAESTLDRALAIRVKAYGPDAPEVARVLFSRANLWLAQGRLAPADSDAERAFALRQKALGENHPETAASLVQLASIERAGGNDASALAAATRGEAAALDRFRSTARVLEERLALSYAATRPSGLDLALSIAADHPGDSTLVQLAWEAQINSRARVLDEMARRHRAIAAGLDSAGAAYADSLNAASEQLGWLLQSGADATGSGRSRLREVRERKERFEVWLASRYSQFQLLDAPPGSALMTVHGQVQHGRALIAFARYFQAPAAGQDFGWYLRRDAEPSRAGYVAFVAVGGEHRVRAVALGAAARIDSAVARFVRAASTRPNPLRRATDAQRLRKLGLEARRLVWDPVAKAVPPSQELLIVPDGALLLLNFGALPGAAAGKYLVEEAPPIQLLSAERDVLLRPSAGAISGRGLLAVGDADFDGVAATGPPAPSRGATSEPRERGVLSEPRERGVLSEPREGGVLSEPREPGVAAPRSAASDCADFRSLRFERLPESGLEADSVAAAWRAASRDSARVLSRGGASEAAFRELAPEARWLHLATHGFFLPNVCGGVNASGVRVADTVAYENPLLRSGLALAGANQRARAANGAADGILTADEIAKLDLSGVELAVLSACETGRGDVRAGEGVLGLRRGFQIAGVRTVLMSLWAVDDVATREWMRAFYAARLRRGLDVAASVRAADLVVLDARRERGESDAPFYWGAFVGSGVER
ncbi:MAG TPA: CHAT domain-containing tetratricopeptide repeat protein [Candidatus Sulfotelmatobacter sp.]|nr:CHAT domain-containing tetratricopeptide repeat protein [Candidatus Sulfotelmatobacter sp.]